MIKCREHGDEICQHCETCSRCVERLFEQRDAAEALMTALAKVEWISPADKDIVDAIALYKKARGLQ